MRRSTVASLPVVAITGLAVLIFGCNGSSGPATGEPGAPVSDAPVGGVRSPDGGMPPSGASREISEQARDVSRSIGGGLRPAGRVRTGGTISAGPVIWGEHLIVGSSAGSIDAILMSGEGGWSVDLEHPPSTVAVSPQTLFVADGSHVHAMEPLSGRLIWSAGLASPIVTSITQDASAVFVGIASGELVALDPRDGSILYRVALPGRPVDRFTLSDGIVYVTDESGALTAVDASNGAITWSSGYGPGYWSGPAVNGAVIATASVDGTVALFDLAGEPSGAWRAGDVPVLAAPVLSDDRVVVADGAGWVRAFSHAGRRMWEVELPAHLAGVPARVGDTVIVADAAGGLIALDLATGAEQSRIAFGTPVVGEPVLYGADLYVALRDGTVRAIGLDGAPADTPLLSAEGSWALPEHGSFRLADSSATLVIRSQTDALFDVAVASSPPEPLEIRLERDGTPAAVSRADAQPAGALRAALSAGVSYRLVVQRPEPRGTITVTVEIDEIR